MEQLWQGENASASGGAARERALRWFMETQAPLILHQGSFPDWFQGFIARKDAEDRLRDKHLGCFLIRLSDKAIGYILSYKGRDRCRHFVINPTKAGQLLVSGDTEAHNSLTDLIAYYRVSPIEPFGEFLTSSCCESPDSDIYDVVHSNQKEKLVSVQAVRNIWDKQSGLVADKPPALPLKATRKLTARSSLDKTPPPQAVPPVPRQRSPVNWSSLPGQMMYSSLEDNSLQERARPPLTSKLSHKSSAESMKEHSSPKWEYPYNLSWSFSRPVDAPSSPDIVYSELSLSDCRSKSLPILDDSAAKDTSPKLSPYPVKKATCHTVSLNETECFREPASLDQSTSSSLDKLCHDSLYQLAGATQWTHTELRKVPISQQEENLYAQVPAEADHVTQCKLYEQIPDSRYMGGACTPASHSNTYETLEDIKQKDGKKNDIWRRFFPDHKKH